MPWHHGTPDVRENRASGYVLRQEPMRLVRDTQALDAAGTATRTGSTRWKVVGPWPSSRSNSSV